MTERPVVRLHLFFAARSDRAVILRQGPTRQWRMIVWHRENDTFEDGQWVRNRVYVDRCALSPDGRHFLYFMLDGRWSSDAKGSYTAISRPPYWTALALFPQGDTWGGGGVFLDDKHYWASGAPDILGRADHLSRVTVGERGKGCTTGIRLTDGRRAPLDRETTRRLLSDPRPTDVRGTFQRLPVPVAKVLDLYETQGGRLYRRSGADLELIRDFTEMTFEPVRAPYDWRDRTSNDGRHPRDGETA